MIYTSITLAVVAVLLYFYHDLHLQQQVPKPKPKQQASASAASSTSLVPFTLGDLKRKLFPEFHAKYRNFSFQFATSSNVNVSILQKYKENNSGVGSAVWDGSMVLSHFLSKRAPVIFQKNGENRNADVIEIGAGQGLVSITTSLILQKLNISASVYLTDGDESCLLQAEHNLQRHNLSSSINSMKFGVRAFTRLLRWGNSKDLDYFKDKTPSFVFAADVVFENEEKSNGTTNLLHEANHAFAALVQTFNSLITKEKSNILLLAYKRRRRREEKFFNLMRDNNFYKMIVKKRFILHHYRDIFEIYCFAKDMNSCTKSLGKMVRQ